MSWSSNVAFLTRKISAGMVAAKSHARRIIPHRYHDSLGTMFRACLRAVEAMNSPRRDDAPFAPEPLPLQLAFKPGKVLHISESLTWGGAERQLSYLIRGGAHRCSEPPDLLCFRLGESREFDFRVSDIAGSVGELRNVMPASAARDLLKSMGSPRMLERMDRDLAWLPDDVAADVIMIAAELVAKRYGVVHGWQDSIAIAAAIAGLIVGVPRIVISTRNVSPRHFSHYRPYMEAAYRKLAAHKQIVFVNNSAAGAQDYAQWLDVPVERFVVIHNGIAPVVRRRSRDEARHELLDRLNMSRNCLIVGSLFRLNQEKRPLLWVESAAMIARQRADVHFLLFGGGPLAAAVTARAQQLGLGARFKLLLPTHDTEAAYSSMDVLMLTSSHEGTPNIVLEAGLYGVPVVATDAGGTSEAVLNGLTGIIIDEAAVSDELGLAGALSQAVCYALDDTAWRLRTKTEAPKFIETKFGLERMINETLALYS